MDTLRVILSAQSKKAWMAFLWPMIAAGVASTLGVDIGGCQETISTVATDVVGPAIGGLLAPVVTGIVTGGPFGAVAAVAAWLSRNATKK